jgi:hypothetical protein
MLRSAGNPTRKFDRSLPLLWRLRRRTSRKRQQDQKGSNPHPAILTHLRDHRN